jgi:hypothetical protein
MLRSACTPGREGGQVTRLASYFDRHRALADVGLSIERALDE